MILRFLTNIIFCYNIKKNIFILELIHLNNLLIIVVYLLILFLLSNKIIVYPSLLNKNILYTIYYILFMDY